MGIRGRVFRFAASWALRRPRAVGADIWLALALLPLLTAALFALGGDRSYIYRVVIHNLNTAKTLAIAENLSPEHRFRLIFKMARYEDGDFDYTLYARFPATGYALIKAAILPFGDDLAAQIVAARLLMLAMFVAAGMFAYFALVRVSGSRSASLAAVLLAFSAYYALYYADAVNNEKTMDLFGATLTFHGMVVFAQEGRFRQLVAKTCVALLFGWHVYALLLPFIAFGLVGEALPLARRWLAARRRSPESQPAPDVRDCEPPTLRAALSTLVRSRFAALALISILFGSAFLGFNSFNEYDTFRGELSVWEMPLFSAVTKRIFGQDEKFNELHARSLEWDNYIGRQFLRVGGVSLPYALARLVDGFDFPETPDISPAPVAIGVLASVGAIGGAALVRRRRIPSSPVHRYALPLASISLMGFCWAVITRYNVSDDLHEFEGMFYLGVPLTLFTLALAYARARLGERVGGVLAIAVAAFAAALLALSVYQVGKLERDPAKTEFRKNAVAEMSEIRKITRGKTVLLSSDIEKYLFFPRYSEMYYYLAGSFILYDDAPSPKPVPAPDFLISRYRVESPDLLTPDNRSLFLYAGTTDRVDLYRAEKRRLEATQPAASSVFDVYLEGKTLTYVKDPCEPADAARRFFLHVFLADEGDLDVKYRRSGFYGFNFDLENKGESFDGGCMTVEDLPGYPVAALRTGQYVPGEGETWSVHIKPPPDAATLALYEKIYRTATAKDPAARSDWDVYRDGKTLTYLKEPCAESDARGRFLLSVYPKDERDLPEDRRDIGNDSLNFDFDQWGIAFDGKCIIRRQLPRYGVSKVETGQWIPGGERLWTEEIEVGD